MKDERGFALILALGVCVVLAMLTVTITESAISNEHSARMSSQRLAAGALADAGISQAVGMLRGQGVAPIGDVSYSLDGHDGSFAVTLVSPGEYDIVAVGVVGAAHVRRTAHITPTAVTWTGG